MTTKESLTLTAHISDLIARYNPCFSYSEAELEKAKSQYSQKKLEELKKQGFYFDDFERFYLTLQFCNRLGLFRLAPEEYLKELFSQFKKTDRGAFLRDPYLKRISVRETRKNNVLLTEAQYERGEFFQYAMPEPWKKIVVPKIGFFNEAVSFPALYEGETPWVSICPSEISSMERDLPYAFGRTLILGLGLGYYPFRIASSPRVKSITVIEKSHDVIDLFSREILPFFPHREKLKILCADAFDYLAQVEPGEYDFCYGDIWEGWEDGARAYERILPFEKKLYDCEFRYWIYDEILWYRKNLSVTDTSP